MQKKELIYRELLYSALERKRYIFTQLELARKFRISLSTVHNALLPLKAMGAVEVKLRSFHLIDPQKVLYYWASLRNLSREIAYQTRVDKPVKEIEKEMPAGIVFGIYSAYKFRFKDVPADYSEVYVYGDITEIKKRFPKNDLPPNLFILFKDEFLESYGKTTPLAQTFVDLWNCKEWYSREFLNALKKRMGDL